MKKMLLSLLLLFTFFSNAQDKKKYSTLDLDINSLISGTLYSPEKVTKKTKLVILIAGSGPTNRSGNSMVSGPTNGYKYLAEGLAENDIAVFSYDKRMFAQLKAGTLDEKSMLFADMITDAESVFDYFKAQKKYKKIVFAGHSEGSLIGMIAAKDKKADGYVSISGAGRPIDVVLTEQLSKETPEVIAEANNCLVQLKEGKTFKLESKNLTIKSLFRESIQPYMISWIKLNPTVEIQKLSIPVLLINGTKDLQVSVGDAQLLKEAYPKAKLVIIEKMNHVLKEISNDEDNAKSYSNSKLPVAKELVESITEFVRKL